MPKKIATKRKTKRSSKDTISLNKYFTFPVLVVIAFTILVVITLFQITKPVEGVKGVEVSKSQK